MGRPKKVVEEKKVTKKVVKRGRPKKVEKKVEKKVDVISKIKELEERVSKLESRYKDIDADLNDLYKDVEMKDTTTSKSVEDEYTIDGLLDLFAKSKNVKKPTTHTISFYKFHF